MSAREVTLHGGSPWGFRMHGGCDTHQPLRISRVSERHDAFSLNSRSRDRAITRGLANCGKLIIKRLKEPREERNVEMTSYCSALWNLSCFAPIIINDNNISAVKRTTRNFCVTYRVTRNGRVIKSKFDEDAPRQLLIYIYSMNIQNSVGRFRAFVFKEASQRLKHFVGFLPHYPIERGSILSPNGETRLIARLEKLASIRS